MLATTSALKFLILAFYVANMGQGTKTSPILILGVVLCFAQVAFRLQFPASVPTAQALVCKTSLAFKTVASCTLQPVDCLAQVDSVQLGHVAQ